MSGELPRVFAIGLNKTGTSSIREGLALLGVRPIPSARAVEREGLVYAVLRDGDFERALAFADRYRGFDDRPWNVGDMYRLLHARFPDSRFVLTVRDEERWWRSVSHWVAHKTQVRDLYALHLGGGVFDRERFLAHYRAYNEAVVRYFRDAAPDRLLVMDPERGDGWSLLCPFLGLPVPERPFPHANRQSYQAQPPSRPLRGRCPACDQPLATPHRERSPARRSGGVPGPLRRRARDAWMRLRDAARARRERLEADPVRAERRYQKLRERHPSLTVDGLAAVCCFFDPGDSGSRVEHFRRFREGVARAGVPLLTVELAFGDRPHQLGDGGDVLRLRTDTVLWQKERLLNLGIEELLRRGHRRIAWLDADIHFADDRWPWHVAHALDGSSLVQVFDRVAVQHGPTGPPTRGMSSVRYFREYGRLDSQRGRRPKLFRRRRPPGYSGYGWVARAEVLEKALLYDAAVVGGADKLIHLASLPRGASWREAVEGWFASSLPVCRACGHESRAPGWLAHYLAWAERWHEAVGGRVGWADNAIADSFHGSRARRSYRDRHEILLREGFDPARDLRTRADGTLEWASDKPALHADVRRYLRSRDGYA